MVDVLMQEEKRVFLWLNRTEWKELAMVEAIAFAVLLFVFVPVLWLEVFVVLRWF